MHVENVWKRIVPLFIRHKPKSHVSSGYKVDIAARVRTVNSFTPLNNNKRKTRISCKRIKMKASKRLSVTSLAKRSHSKMTKRKSKWITLVNQPIFQNYNNHKKSNPKWIPKRIWSWNRSFWSSYNLLRTISCNFSSSIRRRSLTIVRLWSQNSISRK